ncbi:hypothetical protein glysoja_015713 [Glycine soja]|nr:hypothetical protein glysoja_015713 [Glycine soja]
MVNSSHFLFIQEHVIEFWQEVMDALGPNIKIAVVEGGIRVEDVRVEEVKVKDVKESKPMATVFCHFGGCSGGVSCGGVVGWLGGGGAWWSCRFGGEVTRVCWREEG